MFILKDLLSALQAPFADSKLGPDRSIWFIFTLLAVIVLFTSSTSSNLLRSLQTRFCSASIRDAGDFTPSGSVSQYPVVSFVANSLASYSKFHRRGQTAGRARRFHQSENRTPDLDNRQISADRIQANPERRHIVKGRTSFAVSDVRRRITNAALTEDFLTLWPAPIINVVELSRHLGRYCRDLPNTGM